MELHGVESHRPCSSKSRTESSNLLHLENRSIVAFDIMLLQRNHTATQSKNPLTLLRISQIWTGSNHYRNWKNIRWMPPRISSNRTYPMPTLWISRFTAYWNQRIPRDNIQLFHCQEHTHAWAFLEKYFFPSYFILFILYYNSFLVFFLYLKEKLKFIMLLIFEGFDL